MSKHHQSDYDEATTARCERALVTLLGDIGSWRDHVYLAGGLAPRYIVGSLPEGARPHVGTTDIDLVIGLAVGDEIAEAYRTPDEQPEEGRIQRGALIPVDKGRRGANSPPTTRRTADLVATGRSLGHAARIRICRYNLVICRKLEQRHRREGRSDA